MKLDDCISLDSLEYRYKEYIGDKVSTSLKTDEDYYNFLKKFELDCYVIHYDTWLDYPSSLDVFVRNSGIITLSISNFRCNAKDLKPIREAFNDGRYAPNHDILHCRIKGCVGEGITPEVFSIEVLEKLPNEYEKVLVEEYKKYLKFDATPKRKVHKFIYKHQKELRERFNL